MKNCDVFFQQINKRITVPAGTLLSEACIDAGIFLDLVCGGEGICGKCRVLIRQEDRMESVLACRKEVTESITVILPEEALKQQEVPILENGDEVWRLPAGHFKPAIQKIYVDKAALTVSSEITHVNRIRQLVTGNQKMMYGEDLTLSYPAMKQLDFHLHNPAVDGFTLVTDRGQVIDIQAGDTTPHLYGAAVDIGTTTLVLYLYDMCTGRLLGVYSDRNPQGFWGADVISRIMHCTTHEVGTNELQHSVIGAINDMIRKAGVAIPGVETNLYHFMVCGNTTMQHLFHGYRPKDLGQSPFRALHHETIESRGMDLGLRCPLNARITFLPLIGGFVGADTTAVLLSVRQDQCKRLIIDLGTNGEIAVGSEERYRAASTACGPAFEGAGLSCGMRASAGAIEGLEVIDGKLVVRIIGDGLAAGICGSGVVDLVSVLRRNGILESSGRLLDRSTFQQRHSQNELAERLIKVEGLNAFMAVSPDESTSNKGVYVTQKDIRQIQLAKSAIYTGCLMLLERSGIKGEELDEILLAGAFGNYIHIGNAQQIGLLPQFKGVLTRSVGNAAGTGVQRALLDQREEIRSRELADRVIHVELAADPEFQAKYLSHLAFVGQDERFST
jgi:uncharacterized 2Fe-2S/4Fe-4S cluster protein (DUF4445 family)